jgi:hypothetical protein
MHAATGGIHMVSVALNAVAPMQHVTSHYSHTWLDSSLYSCNPPEAAHVGGQYRQTPAGQAHQQQQQQMR